MNKYGYDPKFYTPSSAEEMEDFIGAIMEARVKPTSSPTVLSGVADIIHLIKNYYASQLIKNEEYFGRMCKRHKDLQHMVNTMMKLRQEEKKNAMSSNM